MLKTLRENTRKCVLDMCRFSALVYLENEEMMSLKGTERVLRQSEKAPVLLDNTEDYNDGQAYITMYGQDGLLGFRGTENTRDWMSDFNVVRVHMETKNVSMETSPLVHYGFIRQYRTLDNAINENIRTMIQEKNISRLHITGHSLGGALASIAAIQLHHEFPEIDIHCYTFGSPRPGDKSFAAMFKNSVVTSYRFLNNNDPVTATPTTWRFCHVHGGQWIYPDGMDDENRTTHWNRFWKIVYHGLKSFLGRTDQSLASFHSIDKYYEDIDAHYLNQT